MAFRRFVFLFVNEPPAAKEDQRWICDCCARSEVNGKP